tara:strand:- start:700 stop:915 length:216 start_codon:yes stop_codon:yes gene_type:complete
VSEASNGRDVYATLYAQKIFFLVTSQPRGAAFEVIPYMDARHYAEMHLSKCRREQSPDFVAWQELFTQTFI